MSSPKIIYLMATGRSGSTWIKRSIASHPKIYATEEVLYTDTHVDNTIFYSFWADKARKDAQWISPDSRGRLCGSYIEYLKSLVPSDAEEIIVDIKLEQIDLNPWF